MKGLIYTIVFENCARKMDMERQCLYVLVCIYVAKYIEGKEYITHKQIEVMSGLTFKAVAYATKKLSDNKFQCVNHQRRGFGAAQLYYICDPGEKIIAELVAAMRVAEVSGLRIPEADLTTNAKQFQTINKEKENTLAISNIQSPNLNSSSIHRIESEFQDEIPHDEDDDLLQAASQQLK